MESLKWNIPFSIYHAFDEDKTQGEKETETVQFW
jgi:hypothetical protein